MAHTIKELLEVAIPLFVPGEELEAKTLSSLLSTPLDTTRRVLAKGQAQGILKKRRLNGNFNFNIHLYSLAHSDAAIHSPYDPSKIKNVLAMKKKEKDKLTARERIALQRRLIKQQKDEELKQRAALEKVNKAIKVQEYENNLSGITQEDLQWMKEQRERKALKKKQMERI